MKRTLSDLETAVMAPDDESLASRTPKLRRAQTDFGISNPRVADVVNSKDGILKLQNRALSMELAKRRRDAELMRLDLQSSVARERAKEAAFIGTNAVLAELDTAVKALLLATGASNPAADGSAASAVNKFLSLGEHPLVDHVDLRTLQLEVDEWCSADAYSQAALSSAEAEMSEEIAKSLLERVRLLQQALNKLSKISALPAGAFETSCSALLKLAESEKFTLQVEIDRLKSAINDLGHRLFVAEKRRCKAEKDLDSLLIGVEVAATAHSSGGHPPIVPSVALGAAPAPTEAQRPSLIPLLPDEVPGTTGSNADVDAKIVSMKQEIALLEEQLAESEKLKDLAERKLNSSMLVLHEDNTSGTEILEILKKEFVHHISSLQSEIAMLRTQLDASHASLAAIEQISSQKIKDLSAMTNAELARLSAALIEAESKLIVAESESRGLQSIKLQVSELHFTVDSLRAECAALRDQKKKLVSAIERLEQNLSNSRAREAALTVPGSTAGVTSASAREADLEMELEDAKAQMGDLFLEIEAIVNSEEKSRDQCSRILQQMSDNQLLHQSVLEENSKLTIENKSLKIKMKESEIRINSLQSINSQLDGLLSQLKRNESKLFSEYSKVKQSASEFEFKIKSLEAVVIEGESKRTAELNRYELLKLKWAALTERVTVVTSDLHNERKKRLKFEAEVKKEKNSGPGEFIPFQRSSSTTSQASEGGDHNQQLLDVTLDMLRCSVCRDRFKAVAITRCFHLFCKECIDENLRNRHRKCPACGEKFGQDDVRQVYFTH